MSSAEAMAESFDSGNADDQKLMGGCGGTLRRELEKIVIVFIQASTEPRLNKGKSNRPTRIHRRRLFLPSFPEKTLERQAR